LIEEKCIYSGYRIYVSGRLTRKERAAFSCYSHGSVPLSRVLLLLIILWLQNSSFWIGWCKSISHRNFKNRSVTTFFLSYYDFLPPQISRFRRKHKPILSTKRKINNRNSQGGYFFSVRSKGATFLPLRLLRLLDVVDEEFTRWEVRTFSFLRIGKKRPFFFLLFSHNSHKHKRKPGYVWEKEKVLFPVCFFFEVNKPLFSFLFLSLSFSYRELSINWLILIRFHKNSVNYIKISQRIHENLYSL